VKLVVNDGIEENEQKRPELTIGDHLPKFTALWKSFKIRGVSI
jgi:hypothetical protein